MQFLTKPAALLNIGNELSSGLVFDSALSEGSGTIAKDSINTQNNGTIVASGATWEKNIYGPGLDFSAAASSVSYTTPSAINSLSKVSIEVTYFCRSLGGSLLGRLVHKKNNTQGYFQFYPQSNILQFDVAWTTTGKWVTSGTPVIGLNTWIHAVVTYDFGATTNNAIFYLNGLPIPSSTLATPVAPLLADDTNLYLGNRGDGLRNFDGKIAYSRIWNRILSPNEVLSLYTNPWQIYRRPNYDSNFTNATIIAYNDLLMMFR